MAHMATCQNERMKVARPNEYWPRISVEREKAAHSEWLALVGWCVKDVEGFGEASQIRNLNDILTISEFFCGRKPARRFNSDLKGCQELQDFDMAIAQPPKLER